ncbi:hypothetical protein DH2020_028418 [Rehmannia glutinosa]|uniref:R3H domain-containing protein n=1 Tax=Rehmannia glutinosa TaxID=99300 RepID=A0ABR0VRH0_REHGL
MNFEDLASSGRRRIDEEMNSNIANSLRHCRSDATVEELAFLVKDNLPCKHLILSVEDVLVNFLQDDTSLDGVLELEPMNPYNRLLVHRLADIFGPPILVSDFFLELDEVQSPINFEEIRRKEVMPGQRNNVASKSSFEERETSYFAARKRIFSVDASETKLVTENELSLSDTKECARAAKDLKIQYLDERDISSSNELGTAKHPRPCTTTEVPESSGFKSTNSTSKGPHQPRNDATQTKGKDINTQENYLRKEHMGAAKRLFANALGMHRRDVNIPKCDETKKTSC